MLARRAEEDASNAGTAKRQAKEAAQDARAESERQRDEAIRSSYVLQINLADRELHDSKSGIAEDLLDKCPSALRHWEWGYLKHLCRLDLLTAGGRPDHMACVVYSPDGTRLASAGYPIAKIWEALTGQEKFALRGHKYATTSIAYSHDGQQEATAGFDQTVRVWEAATGKELVKLQGHSGNVMSVAFSPDDKCLASASSLTGNV